MSILERLIAAGREPTTFELQCNLTLEEQQVITTLDPDTVKRNYAEYVVQLSPKRLGISLGNALKIARGEIKPIGGAA